MVYLHGFPDQSLDHRRECGTYGDLSTRIPHKLAEAFLQEFPGGAFVAMNFSGTPGSDCVDESEAGETGAFFSKTVSREVADAKVLLRFLRQSIVQDDAPIHIVGISTGAIVASLMRNCGDSHMTITAIAGLVDVTAGLNYDFSETQLAAFDAEGSCLKEFWLPTGSPSNPPTAESPTEEADGDGSCAQTWRKHFLRLGSRYREDFLHLNIREAVARAGVPLLVIHGDKDRNVPLANGQALFEAAAEPKQLVVIKGGDHLLRSSKHLHRAAAAILDLARGPQVARRDDASASPSPSPASPSPAAPASALAAAAAASA